MTLEQLKKHLEVSVDVPSLDFRYTSNGRTHRLNFVTPIAVVVRIKTDKGGTITSIEAPFHKRDGAHENLQELVGVQVLGVPLPKSKP